MSNFQPRSGADALARLLVLDAPADLSSDQSRWAVYLAALKRRDLDEAILASLVVEPEQPLRSAVVIAAIERDGGANGEVWVATLDGARERDYAIRRLDETRLLSALNDGADAETLTRLVEGTDWLQRRAAAECLSVQVLQTLSERGRTKRVRRLAASRLSKA